MDIKQIHCSFDITEEFDFEQFSTKTPDNSIIAFTVDVEDFYYHLPTLPIPEFCVCVSCFGQDGFHTPECMYQKTNEFVYLTEEGYDYYKVPKTDMVIKEDNITTLSYNTFVEEYNKRGRGRPKKQSDTIKKRRFPNHVEMNYKGIVSVKLNKNKIIIMSLPNDKSVYLDLVESLKRFLNGIVTFDESSVVVVNVNVQFDHLNVEDFETLYSKEFGTDPYMKLKDRSLIPKTAINTVLSKAILTKFNLRNKNHKYSVTIFRTGVLQVFISHCSDTDVKTGLCEGKSSLEPFFDIDTFDLTQETMYSLEKIVKFVSNDTNQTTMKKRPRTKRYSKRIDGYQPRGCPQKNRPFPYSFYGSCPKFNYAIDNTKLYPCCYKFKKNDKKSISKKGRPPFMRPKSGIIVGNIVPGGHAFINGNRVNIDNVKRNRIILTDGRSLPRTEFDTEKIFSYGLQTLPKEVIVKMFDMVYDMITPMRDAEIDIVFQRIPFGNLSSPFYENITPKFLDHTDNGIYLPNDTILAGLVNRELVFDMYKNMTIVNNYYVSSFPDDPDEVIPGVYSKSMNAFASLERLDDLSVSEKTRCMIHVSNTATLIFEKRVFDVPLYIHNKKKVGNRNEVLLEFETSMPAEIVKSKWYVFTKMPNGRFYPKRHISKNTEPLISDSAIKRFF